MTLGEEGRTDDESSVLPHTWIESERFVPRRFVRPVQRILAWESTAGIATLGAAIVALVWANGPFGASYFALWATPASVRVGDVTVWDGTMRSLVNDVAMTVFFFVVTVSIKQQVVAGDLRDPRRAALPVLAAAGGMIVPALLYLVIAGAPETQHGWGIPVATDVAFAVGVLALLGRRVPLGARIFLLTLAVADDIGGILVIALFYPSNVRPLWLVVTALVVVVAALLRQWGVRALPPFVALGVLCWWAMSHSGVEPTITGVLFGALVPMWAFYDPRRVHARGAPLLLEASQHAQSDPMDISDYERIGASLREVSRLIRESTSPVERILTRTAPWVSFVILPVFALANAGVRLDLGALTTAETRVALGVGVGLVLGKPIGIIVVSAIAVRLGLGRLPSGTTWPVLGAVGVTAGVGFTVALYVAAIAFVEPGLRNAARIGILGGSLVAAICGVAVMSAAVRHRPHEKEPQRAT